MAAVFLHRAGVERDDGPDAGEVVPVVRFCVAAERSRGRIRGTAFEFVAAVGHFDGFGTAGGQQDILVDVSAADVVEVVRKEFAKPDLIGQDNLVGDAEFDAAAEGDGELGEAVFFDAGILRQPFACRTEGLEINLFAGGIIGVRVEMIDGYTYEDIGGDLMVAQGEAGCIPRGG